MPTKAEASAKPTASNAYVRAGRQSFSNPNAAIMLTRLQLGIGNLPLCAVSVRMPDNPPRKKSNATTVSAVGRFKVVSAVFIFI